jgi:hypothetical protein
MNHPPADGTLPRTGRCRDRDRDQDVRHLGAISERGNHVAVTNLGHCLRDGSARSAGTNDFHSERFELVSKRNDELSGEISVHHIENETSLDWLPDHQAGSVDHRADVEAARADAVDGIDVSEMRRSEQVQSKTKRVAEQQQQACTEVLGRCRSDPKRCSPCRSDSEDEFFVDGRVKARLFD